MKFWRPGITGKLFLAIFATCIVLLISMHWAVRISFERGFIDYIKRGNEQRLTMLSDALSEQYAQHGSWAFLRNNDRFIFQLLRTFERDNDCLLYTSDAADDLLCVDLGGRRII